MKHRFFLQAFLLLCLAIPSAAKAELGRDINQVLRHKFLNRVETGIMVVRLGGSPNDVQTLYRNQSDIPLIPASNLKLVTTAAAMEKLGPDFRFRTLVALKGEDVVVWGDGDPTLGDVEMLRKVGWGTTTVFENWAEQLRKRGVTRVRNVIVDDSVFDTVFQHPNWPANQIHKRYVAGVGGLNLNANCVDFMLKIGAFGQPVTYQMDPPTRFVNVNNTCVRGNDNAVWLTRRADDNNITLGGQTNASSGFPISITIHDPPMFGATVLAETLAAKGITVTGQVLRDRTDIASYYAADEAGRRAWTFIAAHETPLHTVLARTNKDSMNMYAESLLKRMGHSATNQPGSWTNGTAAIGEYLLGLGIPAEQFKLDDGSGLSRQNLVSAGALVRILINNFYSKNREMWVSSLAIADVDGTFSNRFSGSSLSGRVFGKSGYIDGVSTFSGYLKAKDGQWYAFSILMNNIPPGSNSTMKDLQERIVKAVDDNVEKVTIGG